MIPKYNRVQDIIRHNFYANPAVLPLFLKIFLKGKTFYYSFLPDNLIDYIVNYKGDKPYDATNKVNNLIKIMRIQQLAKSKGINNRLLLTDTGLRQLLLDNQNIKVNLAGFNEYTLLEFMNFMNKNKITNDTYIIRKRNNISMYSPIRIIKYENCNIQLAYNVVTEPCNIIHTKSMNMNGYFPDIGDIANKMKSLNVSINDHRYYRSIINSLIDFQNPNIIRFAFLVEKLDSSKLKVINQLAKMDRGYYYNSVVLSKEKLYNNYKNNNHKVIADMVRDNVEKYNRTRLFEIMQNYSIMSLVLKNTRSTVYLELVHNYELKGELRNILFTKLIVSIRDLVIHDIVMLFRKDIVQRYDKWKTGSLLKINSVEQTSSSGLKYIKSQVDIINNTISIIEPQKQALVMRTETNILSSSLELMDVEYNANKLCVLDTLSFSFDYISKVDMSNKVIHFKFNLSDYEKIFVVKYYMFRNMLLLRFSEKYAIGELPSLMAIRFSCKNKKLQYQYETSTNQLIIDYKVRFRVDIIKPIEELTIC